MANFLTLSNEVEMATDIKGRYNNPYAIEMTVANTNPSGTTQRSTVTISNAGTSGKTVNQLAAMIDRITIFDVSSGNESLWLATSDEPVISGATAYADATGQKATVVVVELTNGTLLVGYAAAHA